MNICRKKSNFVHEKFKKIVKNCTYSRKNSIFFLRKLVYDKYVTGKFPVQNNIHREDIPL